MMYLFIPMYMCIYLFIPMYMCVSLFIPMFIYLSVRNALPMIPLSQVNVSLYVFLDFIGPHALKHFFNDYYTIFKLILFQYDTSLSNNFCGIIDQCG